MSLKHVPAMLASLWLAGCIYQPKVDHYYEADCEIELRKMTMSLHQRQELLYGQGVCSDNQGCLTIVAVKLIAAAVALPASAIVSGSIVVVGNSIFWMQERGECPRTWPTPAA